MHIIDRRLNPGGKNLPNRQRFLRRARRIVREAVRQASASRSIRDIDEAGVVVIPGNGIDEPSFHLGGEGHHQPIFPGNKEFVEGDRLPRGLLVVDHEHPGRMAGRRRLHPATEHDWPLYPLRPRLRSAGEKPAGHPRRT
jgi:uncharacterized sporulation protein YeaH/YhbH (DUF444 family)